MRTAEVMAAIDQEVPLAPQLSVDDGVSRNAHFVQFLADVLGTHEQDRMSVLAKLCVVTARPSLSLTLCRSMQ